MSRPFPEAVVITVGGELDAAGVGPLRELLHCRLQTALHIVVLDLSAVRFLCMDGLELLAQAHARTIATNRTLLLVGTQPAVARPVRAAGLQAYLPPHRDVPTALRTAWSDAESAEPAARAEERARSGDDHAAPELGGRARSREMPR